MPAVGVVPAVGVGDGGEVVEQDMRTYMTLGLMWKKSKWRLTWSMSIPKMKMKQTEAHLRRGGDFSSQNESI